MCEKENNAASVQRTPTELRRGRPDLSTFRIALEVIRRRILDIRLLVWRGHDVGLVGEAEDAIVLDGRARGARWRRRHVRRDPTAPPTEHRPVASQSVWNDGRLQPPTWAHETCTLAIGREVSTMVSY